LSSKTAWLTKRVTEFAPKKFYDIDSSSTNLNLCIDVEHYE